MPTQRAQRSRRAGGLPAWLLAAALAPNAGAAEDAALAAARLSYETGHYQRAFAQLAALANGGHCEAARMAREMWRHGPRLYGMRFEASEEWLARWAAVPRCVDIVPAADALAQQ